MIRFEKLFYNIVAALALIPGVANAQISAPPALSLPLACTIGKDCWILNYPDVGPADDKVGTDPACLNRTYEAHKGTDFAIPDEAAMKKGVDVLAAKGGTVTRVRDGEADRWPTPEDLEKTKADRRECGNAVLIDHGDGWQTMYCHMKKGSLTVKANQTVKAGDKIGQVGLSGLTEFPHLHFGVIHNDKVMDPFTGANLEETCGQTSSPLWDSSFKLPYEPLVFFHTGFDSKPPKLTSIDRKRVDHAALRNDSAALVFHAIILGAREGDDVHISILNPDGTVWAERTLVQEKTRARQMFYIGRKIPESAPLDFGTYKGIIKIIRKDKDGNPQPFTDEKSILIQ